MFYILDIFVVCIADTATLSPGVLMAVTYTLYVENGYRLSKTTIWLSGSISIVSPTSSMHWSWLIRLYRRMYLSAGQGFDVDFDHDTLSSSGEEVFDTANSFTGPETNNNEHKVNIYIAPILLVLSLHYNCDGIHMCYNTDLFRHSVTMCRRSLMPFSICVTVLQHI